MSKLSGILGGLLFVIFVGCAEKIVLVNGKPPVYPYHTSKPHGSRWVRADSLWNLRSDFTQARKMLNAYRTAADRQDKAPELWSQLSHACYYVANYVETSTEKKDLLFVEGQKAALQALDLNPAFHLAYKETGDESASIHDVDADYVEALFWYTANLGRELSQESVIIRQGNKYKLEAFNNRMLELNNTFYYGGPERVAAIVPVRLPGGDRNVSKAHFEKAIRIAPLYFANRVLFAEIYAVATHDKQTFLDQLNFVVNTPFDTLPAIASENQADQNHAKTLLAQVNALFK